MMNNTMNYKDFSAKVEYSAEDGCFIGRVLGIADAVEFRGKSLDELEQGFRAALDGYLAECAKEGVEPGKTYSGKFALRLPIEMHKALHMRSEAMGASINELIVSAIGMLLSRGRGRGGEDMLTRLPFSYGALQINEQAADGHGHGHRGGGPHGRRGKGCGCGGEGHDHGHDHEHSGHGCGRGRGRRHEEEV